MDIQRDEAFEESYSNICKPIIARPYPRKENGEYVYKEIHEAYLMWQAAKAQAVPEGFVLVEKDLVQSIHRSCVNSLIAESMPAFKIVANTIIDELSPLVKVIQTEAQEPTND